MGKKISKIILSIFMVMTLCMNITIDVHAANVITDIDITNVTIPHSGETVSLDTSGITVSPSGATISTLMYYHIIPNEPAVQMSSGQFEEGEQYEMYFVLDADPNYTFDENLTGSINNLDATVHRNASTQARLYYRFYARNQISVSSDLNSIEAGTMGTRTCINVANYVSGGQGPYTYDIDSDYAASLFIDDTTGMLTATRNNSYAGGNATLTVSDAYGCSTQKEITIGAITRPADYKGYYTYVGGQRVTDGNKK